MAIVCLVAFASICRAQAQNAPQSDALPTKLIESNEEPAWRLETTGSFTNVTDNYGNWYGGSASLTYLGSEVFTPTISVTTQTRPEGDQQTYGLASYIHFSKYFYAHIGAGTAPNRGTILFPSFRYDAMGFVKLPQIKGLITTVGYSNYRMGGHESRAISVGGIYYLPRVILNGSISFHTNNPGGLTSKSGQFSFMTGKQGSYWIGAGAHGGDLNYQLLGTIPYNAHFTGYGFSAHFKKWIQKNWGLTERYYFTNLMSTYKSNSVSLTFFYEF